jgi:hypothetical protein
LQSIDTTQTFDLDLVTAQSMDNPVYYVQYAHARIASIGRRAMERVKAHSLVMKLSDAEWQWDRRKLTFYFTAEKRVDFRALVRDLAAAFRTRIELKQIGVRDEAKRLSGIGRCGRETLASCSLSSAKRAGWLASAPASSASTFRRIATPTRRRRVDNKLGRFQGADDLRLLPQALDERPLHRRGDLAGRSRFGTPSACTTRAS